VAVGCCVGHSLSESAACGYCVILQRAELWQ
jgi:hypothetical protein